MKKQALLIVLCLASIACVFDAAGKAGASFASDDLTTVFLVRHAEKGATPTDNPPLTEAGGKRAEELARMLGSSGIQAIFSTNYVRTQKTAEPLAKRLGVTVNSYQPKEAKKLAETVLNEFRGKTVLVVGHSNTLPDLIEAFGAERVPALGDTDYDNLFVVTIDGNGKAKAVRLKFGAPSP